MKKIITTNFTFIFPAFLFLLTGIPALANTDIFYGQNSLNALVDREKTILTLPGGNRVEIVDQKITYALPDHSPSVHIAVREDNIVSKHTKHTQHLSLIHISEPTRPY